MKVSPQRDWLELRKDESIEFLGPTWLESSHADWEKVVGDSSLHYLDLLSIDLSKVSFVTLFDWVSLVAVLDWIIEASQPKQVDLDILGSSTMRLLDIASFLAIERGGNPRVLYTKAEVDYSRSRYRLAGFLEALGTYGVLNRPGRSTKVIYPGLSQQAAALRSFYASRPGEKPTVLLGLKKIETKEDCKLFLDDSQILNWRRAMDERFRASPLFEADEVWRIFCHELAVNVWEHSGSVGFVAARVVDSVLDKAFRLRPWCKWSYPPGMHSYLRSVRGPFLELCIADAGRGFGGTLRDSLAGRLGERVMTPVDVLSFAFDELGTCKDRLDSWASSRHGLWRILTLVVKYGGALRLRSGDAEIYYISDGAGFRRRKNNLGYEPQLALWPKSPLRGSQIQLLLPLIPVTRSRSTSSILDADLPTSFRTQMGQPRGHMVPLHERLEKPDVCIGREEVRIFRLQCERLSRQLLQTRPRTEPLVLDFTGLDWPAGQLETLLYFLQNVIQGRPALLVEVDDRLAESALEFEWNGAATELDPDILFDPDLEAAEAVVQQFREVAERVFLETYRGIGSTVLMLTREGKKHILGLPSKIYEDALLSLLIEPSTIERLCARYSLRESILRVFLNSANPLFENVNGVWSLAWTNEMLAVEMSRAVISHFDAVAVRSAAWRGRRECGDTGRERFCIPWAKTWRREFLQSARILNRGRQADEVAQRLIYRLRLALSNTNRKIEDVRVIVCVSAPAMLLAAALHRWWPVEERPAVADLGYYVFLGDGARLPEITEEGGAVLAQDVLDEGAISRWVIQSLENQGLEVLALLSFVRFHDTDAGTKELARQEFSVPVATLVEVPRPTSCEPPTRDDDDAYDYWVEPRSLRPVKLRTLRREFMPGRDPDLERRDEYLDGFDNHSGGSLISAGHFVYGVRHYTAVIDMRRALTGEVGDRIAGWLADICEDADREREGWEREDGYALRGDVTAVLMPLHSQIHYLWPKVENILAQRGRRQPVWLLEPTVFSGSGPTYRLPLQLRHQLQQIASESRGAHSRDIVRPARFLIIDDAIATGRTAVAILSSILREVRKFGKGLDRSPVEWIRYFALVNQSDHAAHTMWQSVLALARPRIKFVVEEYAPFMGMIVYGESNCPACRELQRLGSLLEACGEFGAQGAHGWIEKRMAELRPVAVDGKGFGGVRRPKLKRRLDVLSGRRRNPNFRPVARYKAAYVDTAIWRLHELWYLSCPPSEILRGLAAAWPADADSDEIVSEYERYRWAVYEKCVHAWRRVVSDGASELFRGFVLREVEEATGLAERLLELMATRYYDDDIQAVVCRTIDRLAELERGRREEGRETSTSRIEQAVRLDTSLQLFFFNAQRISRSLRINDDDRGLRLESLLTYLEVSAASLERLGNSLLGNLRRRLERPQRFADPRWALEVLAESIFRGRGTDKPHAGSHQLLPRLLSEALKGTDDPELLRLLHGSLVLFLAALDDMMPYAEMRFSVNVAEVRELAEAALRWLRLTAEQRAGRQAPELRYLFQALELESEFCEKFGELFHEEPEKLGPILRDRATEQQGGGSGRLKLSFEVLNSAKGVRLLTHVQRLVITLENRAIDPIGKKQGDHESRIEVSYEGQGEFAGMVCFRILTTFASLAETRRLISDSRNNKAEESLLGVFGVKFGGWIPPQEVEVYNAESRIYVPVGFSGNREG